MGSACKRCCSSLFFESRSKQHDLNNLKEKLTYDKIFHTVDNKNKKKNRSSDIWSNKTKFDDFNILIQLGRGSYGSVVLAKKKSNNKLYALKILNKSKIKFEKQVDHTKTERLILEKSNNEFIVKLKYAFQTPDRLCFVTEYMPGGELFNLLKKKKFFNEGQARFYICEVILAIEHLHNNNCIYRDLKPENILLGKDGHIKLTDFGLSKMCLSNDNDNIAYTICGTPEYLAPEILEGRGYNKNVDWWSLGALIYEMLVGVSPYRVKNKEKRLDMKLYKMPVDYKSLLSPEAKSLISGLLSIDPNSRLGNGKNDAKEIKSHKFFDLIDWNLVQIKQLKPPFVPDLKNEEDYSNFAKEFIDQDPSQFLYNNNNIFYEDSDFKDFTFERNEFSLISEKEHEKDKAELSIKKELDNN